MKKPALLRAAIVALLPELARNPDKLAMWVETGRTRATGTAQRGFAWEYHLTVVVEDFTKPPEMLFFIVTDWLRTQQPDLLASNAEGFPFEVDVIDDKTADVKITLPLREIVTATPDGSGGWQLEVQPEPVLFPDAAVIGPGLTSIWVRGNGDAPFQVAPD
ncbi:MAG: phage tail protein, partial [Pseudomonadota bacterium]